MITRLLLTATAALLLLAPPAAAGGSGPQPTTQAQVLSDGSVRLTATGCAPTVPATFTIRNPSANSTITRTDTTDTAGNAEIVVLLPNGDYEVTVSCQGPDGQAVVQQFALDVNRQPGGGSGSGGSGGGTGGVTTRPLPRTGADTLPLARLGAVLLAGGGVAVYAGQKRRQRMKLTA